jgi:zinc and cadmium transporter
MELSPFILTIIWNIVVALWIIIVVLITRLIKTNLTNYLEYITALTVWLLLWIIFLGFIPELTEWGHLVGSELWIFILIGVFIFYLLELFLHWHHCKDLWHESKCHSHHTHEHKNWILMFGWTMLHNSFHGIVIFSAFSVNFNFWVATTIAVLLHSIPQNIVNYIMNSNNIKYAYFAAFGGILWAIFTFPFADFLIANKYYILAIIAWWLLYTALADIFPEFKWKWTTTKKIWYLVFIILWIFLFLSFEELIEWEHHSHDMNNELHEDELHEDELHEDELHEGY